MDWGSLQKITNRNLLHAQLKAKLTQQTYDAGEWTVTELLTTDDPRRNIALDVLEGRKRDKKKDEHFAPSPVFVRLRVLTRQACWAHKGAVDRLAPGGKPLQSIFETQQAFDVFGEDGDVLPSHDDKPEPGDLVKLKGQAFADNPDTGKPMDGATNKAWVRQRRSLTDDEFYPVDKDRCITVPVLGAYRMLLRNGVAISKSQFRKVDPRNRKSKRKVTNWWFKETAKGKGNGKQ